METLPEVQIFDKKFTAPELFKRSVLSEIVEKVRAEVSSHVPDLGTDKGRKNIASLARRVASTKTLIDDAGKNYVAALKSLPKEIDEHRKWLRDQLDAIRDETRKPLDEWEAERSRAEKLIGEAVLIGKMVPETSVYAVQLLENLDTLSKESITQDFLAKLEQAIAEAREIINLRLSVLVAAEKEKERKAAEESERARIEAEEKRKREIAEAEERARQQAIAEAYAKNKADREARELAERRQKDAEEAERRAEERRIAEAKAAEERRIAEAKAAEERRKREVAEAEERARIKAEAEKKELEEKEEAAARDQERRSEISNHIMMDLQLIGIRYDDSMTVAAAIMSGKIRHISVDYL